MNEMRNISQYAWKSRRSNFTKKCPRNQHLRYGAIIQSAKEARSKKGRQG